jgi:hypothetical protein
MKIKIPKKIILFGEIYTIHLVNKMQIKTMSGEDEELLGYLNPGKKQILLVNDEEVQNTFLHELGHYFAQTIIGTDNEATANAFATFVEGIINQCKEVKK